MGAGLVRAGFDEAGLGPTLGPLVVAGFATRGPRSARTRGPIDDLLAPMAALVGGPGRRVKGDRRIEVGDSKKIHTGSRKFERIERTALATVAWMRGELPDTVGELLQWVSAPQPALVAEREAERPEDRRAPWWRTLDETLPVVCARDELLELGADLGALGRRVGVEPLWYRADVLSAARVNRELRVEAARVDTKSSKNTWATHAVLRHAACCVQALDAPEMALWCDKAGGRKAYLEPLDRAFAHLGLDGEGDSSVGLVDETRPRSRYLLATGGRRVDLGFVMGGDRLDPRISWASILAKYLRELIMRSFNRYFRAALAEAGETLRPTAGYPEDARRFITSVEAALGEGAGLGRDAWVRSK